LEFLTNIPTGSRGGRTGRRQDHVQGVMSKASGEGGMENLQVCCTRLDGGVSVMSKRDQSGSRI
jgi:hypothetical protein